MALECTDQLLLITHPTPLIDIPQMTTQTYPGKGLSLSQFVFALNVSSPSYVANVLGLKDDTYC